MKKQKYICMHCGIKIIPENMQGPMLCIHCHRKRSRDYQAAKRWLNGGPDNHLLGEDIKIELRSINGNLRVKI